MGEVNAPRAIADSDDLSEFRCGRETLDDWLRGRAIKNQRSDATRTYVVTPPHSSRVVGYVALASAQINRSVLPGRDRRNRPDPVPVILLARLAIDLRFQGKGVGGDFLSFAASIAIAASESVGVSGMVTHPIDEQARAFYASHDFTTLSADPKRPMFARIADMRGSGITSKGDA